jgi:hypothetical protein
MQDTMKTCEIVFEDEEAYSKEEDAGGSNHGHYNELLDELDRREKNILRRMAKICADPTEFQERVWKFGWLVKKEIGDCDDGRVRHRQFTLKHLRRNLKKSDEWDMSTGGGRRFWVDVDKSGCPTGQHRPYWLTRLRGYSRDLDWSVDNFNAHPRSLLIAIKNKMAAQFKYRGGLGDVSEKVFFQILRQQMRTRRSNMKKLIENGGQLPPYVKKQHFDNFKKLIARTDKIAEASRLKAARHSVQNLSNSGRSEGQTILRLVSDLLEPCCE